MTNMNILQQNCNLCQELRQRRQFFANSILGKILRKTSNLGKNFAEDDITGKNVQNIMGFG